MSQRLQSLRNASTLWEAESQMKVRETASLDPEKKALEFRNCFPPSSVPSLGSEASVLLPGPKGQQIHS